MRIPSSWRYAALVGLFAAALLPWIGHRMRRDAGLRCALDGAFVNRAMRVRITSGQHGDSQLCSLFCAEKWLQVRRLQPDEILVVDESTGEEIDAAKAFFVRSQVVTHGPTRERRHVFSTHQDAKSHADSHAGRILAGDERPFAKWLDRQVQPVAKQFQPQGELLNRESSHRE